MNLKQYFSYNCFNYQFYIYFRFSYFFKHFPFYMTLIRHNIVSSHFNWLLYLDPPFSSKSRTWFVSHVLNTLTNDALVSSQDNLCIHNLKEYYDVISSWRYNTILYNIVQQKVGCQTTCQRIKYDMTVDDEIIIST